MRESVWNMKKPVLSNTKHYNHIEKIRDDIRTKRYTMKCPRWGLNWGVNIIRSRDEQEKDCRACYKLFPRIKGTTACPCMSTYTPKHLVNVLNSILRANHNLKPKEK